MSLCLGPIRAEKEFFPSPEEAMEIEAREAARRDVQMVADQLREQFSEKLAKLINR